jgi:catechol-2,3-dioxygenase
MKTRLAVVSLWAENVPEAVHFYRDVVGLKLLPSHGWHQHFDLGGTYLVILSGKPVPAQNSLPSRFPLLAFGVANLEAAIEKLEAHHVQRPWGIEQDANSRWVMFTDPAGNLIEMAEFRQR